MGIRRRRRRRWGGGGSGGELGGGGGNGLGHTPCVGHNHHDCGWCVGKKKKKKKKKEMMMMMKMKKMDARLGMLGISFLLAINGLGTERHQHFVGPNGLVDPKNNLKIKLKKKDQMD